jgi:hypothetical protein
LSRPITQISPINQTLLGLVRDGLVSDQLAEKITMRISIARDRIHFHPQRETKRNVETS